MSLDIFESGYLSGKRTIIRIFNDLFLVLSGRKTRIVSERSHDCLVCLSEAEAESSYSCECGAVYHTACIALLGSCCRCRKEFDCSASAPINRIWLPKYAVFPDSGQDRSFSSLHCMNCSAEVDPSDSFCLKCGYHLSTVEGFLCPVCDCEIEPDEMFCSCCGADYGKGTEVLIQCPFCNRLSKAGTLTCSCGMEIPPTCSDCGLKLDGNLFCKMCNNQFVLPPYV